MKRVNEIEWRNKDAMTLTYKHSEYTTFNVDVNYKMRRLIYTLEVVFMCEYQYNAGITNTTKDYYSHRETLAVFDSLDDVTQFVLNYMQE